VAIVDKLLQKQPDKRYQSAAELIADLESATAPPPSVIQPVPETVSGVAPVADAPTVSGVAPAADPSTVSGMAPAPASGMTMHKAILVVIGFVIVIGTLITTWVSMRAPAEPTSVAVTKTAQEFVDEGIAYLNEGQETLALTSFERALQVDSTYAPAWSSMAGVLLQLGDATASIRAARRAITLNPQSSGAWYTLGLATAAQDDLEGAIDALTTAVQLNRAFVRAYSAWADILIEDGRPEEALDVLDDGLATAPASNAYRFILYKNQGKAYMAMDQPAEAINYLESSYRLNDSWPETMLLLGRAYDALGDRSQAQVYWERFLEFETDPVLRAEARQRLGL